MRKTLVHDPPSLTTAREDAGLSKAALARAIKCTRSLITEYEDGTRNVPTARLEAIANVLGCDIEELRARPAGGDESGGKTSASSDVGMHKLRDGERAVPDGVPELPDARVAGG